MKEVWKDIYFKDKGILYDYRGKYQVSNLGRIKSLKYWSGVHKRYYDRERIMKPVYDSDGYLMIMLHKGGVGTIFKVHRLVGIMFIPNPLNKPEVNHKFGIKTDNRASQLEWATTSENQKHAYDIGLNNHYKRKVLQYDLNGNFIKEWDSIKEAAYYLNIKYHNSITNCCGGRSKTAGGFIWKYKD